MTSRAFAVAADVVFDGMTVREHCAVMVADGRVTALARRSDVPDDMPVEKLPEGAWLAPGFIDLQVNGGGDVLFNDRPTPAGIAAIIAAHRRFGTTSMLPTLITDTEEKMRAAREAVASAMPNEPGLLGVHFEGPFLSPEKCGVHDPSLMRAPNERDYDLLTSRKGGVTLVTLAPECVPKGFVQFLANNGVRVALGHSMASYEQTKAAIAEGLTGFTHLFNAMRPMSAREPGPIAAALERDNCWYGLIADGVHVAAPMLHLALRGRGTPVLVTDAMPPVGGIGKPFSLYGREIVTKGERVETKDGTLAGSGIDMATAVRNCMRLLGVNLTDALAMASRAPAKALGLDNKLGRLASGFRADMIALDPLTVRVLTTWVAGN